MKSKSNDDTNDLYNVTPHRLIKMLSDHFSLTNIFFPLLFLFPQSMQISAQFFAPNVEQGAVEPTNTHHLMDEERRG